MGHSWKAQASHACRLPKRNLRRQGCSALRQGWALAIEAVTPRQSNASWMACRMVTPWLAAMILMRRFSASGSRTDNSLVSLAGMLAYLTSLTSLTHLGRKTAVLGI